MIIQTATFEPAQEVKSENQEDSGESKQFVAHTLSQIHNDGDGFLAF